MDHQFLLGSTKVYSKQRKDNKKIRFIICIMYRNFSLVSVETTSSIPKKYLKKMGKITHQIKVEAPIKIGQVIAKNLFGKKIDLVATRKVDIKN